jgi:hypothetical protein
LFESTISHYMHNQSSLQILGSRILAAALSEVLPNLLIEEAGIAFNGFYCDFSFSEPISSEILILLEERIRQIIREKRLIRKMEMVPECASEFLKKNGQKRRAAQVFGQDQYVPMIQIGSFVDWCENVPFNHTGDAGIVRLIERISQGKGRFRIFGIAEVSKDALKSRLKHFQQFPLFDHEKRGAERQFWEIIEGKRIWLAPGLEELRRLCGFWRKAFAAKALEVDGDESKYPLIAAKRQKMCLMHFARLGVSQSSMRGLLDASGTLVLQINSFDGFGRDCISFLQILHQSLTILGFKYRIRLLEKKRKTGVIESSLQQEGWKADERLYSDESRLEFVVRDALQCEWIIAAICERKHERGLFATVWVERNMALLLEMSNGFEDFPQQ